MSGRRAGSRLPRRPPAVDALDRRTLAERLHRRAARAHVDVSEPLLDGLLSYVELLRRWNARVNLTGLDAGDAGLDRLLDRLIVEPLAAARHVAQPAPRIIDIGSGGGSPAIPLRLALGGGSLLMVEARARKAAFLREAVRRLGVASATVEARRFEELASRPPLQGKFDLLTLRAVRVDAAVLRSLQTFLADSGELFLFASARGEDQPPAAEPPLVQEATYPLVESLGSRLVVLRKALAWDAER